MADLQGSKSQRNSRMRLGAHKAREIRLRRRQRSTRRPAVKQLSYTSMNQLRRELSAAQRELEVCLQRDRQWEELGLTISSSPARKHRQPYGDLTRLNRSRLILRAVGPALLRKIARSYLGLLETSSALYEKNGDYAMGLFSSGWCRLLDGASRRRCGGADNQEALSSGKWHCHESCWNEASRVSIETGRAVDVECRGGIRIYAVPIRTGCETIGSINFGYGDPPVHKLRSLSRRFGVGLHDLRKAANSYRSRPPLIIAAAKRNLEMAAGLIGEIVRRKGAEEALRKAHRHLERQIGEEAAQRAQVETGMNAIAADLRHSREQLRGLTARLINAADDERQRVARELHDDLGQRIAALIIESDVSARKIPPRCRGELRLLHCRLEELSDKVQAKAYNLHSSVLDVLGLASALDSLCADFAKSEKIRTRFSQHNVPDSLSGEIALNLFRIAQECLRNISRHARAPRVSVSLKGTKSALRLLVRDSGIGFNLESVKSKQTLGLTSMEERARMLEGTFNIKSRRGQGTQVTVQVPLTPHGGER